MLQRLLPLLTIVFCLSSPAAAEPQALQLSNTEKAWLNAHPSIQLGIDPDWPPFEYFDVNQQYSGMAADYIQLIAAKLNIKMEPVRGLSWSGVLTEAQHKRLDVLPAATATPQREQYLNFTAPYLDFPMVIITRDDAPFIASLNVLRDYRVAVVKNYVSHELLESNHPDLTLVPSITIKESLEALSSGGVDAFVGNLASVSHAIKQLGLTNLKVAAHTPYSFKLSMGVRNDWPELASILDKALASITQEEKARIHSKWVGVEFKQGVELVTVAILVLPVVLAALFTITIVSRNNSRLRQEVAERIEVEKQLRLSEEALNESQRTAKIGWWQWDLGQNTLWWSDEVFNITGKSRDTFTPTPENFTSVIHPDDVSGMSNEIQGILENNGGEYDREFRILRADGSIRHVHSYGKFYGSTIDESRYFAGVIHDITESKMKSLELQEKQQTLKTILDNAPIGIWLQDCKGKLRFVNNAFCNSVGISEQQFLSVEHYSELYPEEIANSCISSDKVALASDTPQSSYEQIEFVDGNLHDLEIIKARLNDDKGAACGLIGLSMDITERKQAEERLRKQAFCDELTGLPNRNYLMEQLSKTLALSKRHGYYSALIFFDLDNFKIINDTLGHHTGDKLLTQVGKLLSEVIRQEDTAARLGGDEFVVIASNVGREPEQAAEHTQLLAEKIHRKLSKPLFVEEHEHHLTFSTGISLFPEADEDINDILKFADTAMYRAKEGGRNAIRFFHPSMQQAAEERFDLQGKMRHALSQEEFELYYQPQYDSDGNIIGAESLLRWHQPELGMVSPARFIPLAEESGMITDIGIWVLREACQQINAWLEQDIDIQTLAVNVSARQFHQPDFVNQVTAIIRESGIEPHRLELELTEGSLVENIDDVTRKIEQLQSMGIRFAIDDFGTGYSSLRYLQQLPLDRLKIDQSFVRDIHNNEANAHIVETIISMAHHLKLELIAEGVESLDEMKFLDIRGCDKYQGYYFSKPLPASELTAKLAQPHEVNA